MARKKEREYEIGNGNVFADLELEDVEELLSSRAAGSCRPHDP
jgi:hypothetical protein